MRVNECIFFVFFVGLLGISLFIFFNEYKYVPRILLYYHVSGGGSVLGLRIRLPRLDEDQIPQKIHDYLRTMISRPPNIFYRAFFEGNASVDVVHVIEKKVYVGLLCASDSILKGDDILLLEEGVIKNFPFLTAVIFSCRHISATE